MKVIKFRARRKDGTLIGYERFEKAHWQCTSIEDFNRDVKTWISGTLASDIKEQYIGLKDKNRVEIYEGDFLRIPLFSPPVMQVAFIEGAFYLADSKGEYTADIHYIHHADREQAEVIGDTYANPELLSPEGGK